MSGAAARARRTRGTPARSGSALGRVLDMLALARAVKGRSGRTPAGWATTWTAVAGACVMAAAVILAVPWLFWAGLALAVAGVPLGLTLSRYGMGVPAGYHQALDVETRDAFVAGRPLPRRRPGAG